MNDADPGEPEVGSLADELSRLFAALHGVDTHAVGDDCRYCPICRTVAVVRSASPEVREHLASAGASMLHAAAALLATPPPKPRRDDGVEHIDLDATDSTEWDETDRDGEAVEDEEESEP